MFSYKMYCFQISNIIFQHYQKPGYLIIKMIYILIDFHHYYIYEEQSNERRIFITIILPEFFLTTFCVY